MGEGLNQITIPDFDDEDFNTSSIPFGHSAGHFGFGTSSGPESPTLVTPRAGERDYFHSRGDSVNSEDSALSIQAPSKYSFTSNSLAHSSQTSLTTTFTKKPSFASLRNAFKSATSKNTSSESSTPPVPPLDRQAYPALRNPFSRSTSSLAHHTPSPSIRRPSVTASPPQPYPFPRPPTPGSSTPDHKHARAPSTKTKGHSVMRSQHSHNGSFFHNSDDFSFGSSHIPRQSTPPPVPRVPNEFSGPFTRNDTPSSSELDDGVVIDPRTPSEYALHAVFMQFAASAESKIDVFLRQSLDRDPPLASYMGPGIEKEFDGTLHSLGRVAMKSTKPVVDSVMRWRKSQLDNVSGDVIRLHSSMSYSSGRFSRPEDLLSALNERKSMASIYIMCRALIAVVQAIPRDALGDVLGNSLEETTFDQFKRPNLKLLTQSANHRTNAELFATLLGKLANIRFVSVTDRFLSELGPVSSGQVPKDLDMKYENLVKGLRHIQIKVWPPESFEEGAEFMESLSKSFEHAHGLRLKTVFAETLVQLLHPIGKTAQAEVNHPLWTKAIETIYPRARDMMNKPRYWNVAYPLVVTTLCVAPHEFFLKHWMACLEASLVKLKERPYRIVVMNGIMRLIWTYLYRCRESISASGAKMESILKHFFPPSRLTVNPNDEHQLEPLIYVVHYVLSRLPDFGRDFVLSLLQEQSIRGSQSNNISHLVGPERVTVALEAVLRSLYLAEKEEPFPTWPSNYDFSVLPDKEDYKSLSTFCPESLMSKPGMQDFFERCGSAVAVIASSCAKSVGRLSIFDEQWSASRMNTSYDETTSVILRQHPEGSVAYPSQMSGQINVLQTCFASWPRCLHPALSMDDAIDMLIRGIIHVEPGVGEAASGTLQRIVEDTQHINRVLSRFSVQLFSPKTITSDLFGARLMCESLRLLNSWYSIIETWANNVKSRPGDSYDPLNSTWVNSQFIDVEIVALFLLGSRSRTIRAVAAKVFRLLDGLVSHFREQPTSPLDSESNSAFRVLDAVMDKIEPRSYLDGLDDVADMQQQDQLTHWKESSSSDILLRIAESDEERDKAIWPLVYPNVIMSHTGLHRKVIKSCRDIWVAAAIRYHQLIVSLSGIQSRPPAAPASRSPAMVAREKEKMMSDNSLLIEQWHLWMKLVSCTASPPESKASSQREHSRAPSEVSSDRDLVNANTKSLFRYLVPFLDSEHSIFRDIAVTCISSFPADAYKDLLDDLGAFSARHFYVDTARVKMSPPPARRNRRQDRLYLAFAHIYQLTSHHLKEQRGTSRQDTLMNVLKFVRHTQAFLSGQETRNDWQQQCLRRYFCGIVEKLFDAMSGLQSSDRFIPANTHLTLYRLCEEWCQCGSQSDRVKQRLFTMQAAATAGFSEPQQKAAIERFLTETRLLSHASCAAMASLCQKAFFPPDQSSGSPTDRISSDFLAPLEIVPTLDRLLAMLASMNDSVRASGRKALRTLVDHKGSSDSSFIDEVLRRSFVISKDPDTSNCRFFEVIADVICSADQCQLTFSHVVCLGLVNLCSPLVTTRRLALSALDAAHLKLKGKQNVSRFEAHVESSAPGVYLDAQFQVSTLLAKEHPELAVEVIIQCASRLPLIQDAFASYAFSHMLIGLSPWLASVTILFPDNSTLTKDGRSVLYFLLSLTLRYSEHHPDPVQLLWSNLVDNRHSNGLATVRFLLEQSSKVGSRVFVGCARKIVACLSRTTFGCQAFEELCEVIEPARMLPTIEHKLTFPDHDDMEFWSDLDALFAEQPKHSLGAGQFALLFLGDVVLTRAWEFKKQLPVLLHAIFTHIGHRNPFVREQARSLFFQTLRAWLPGYEELTDRSNLPSRTDLRSALTDLEKESRSTFWTEDDSVSQISHKISQLCFSALRWLEPLQPTLGDEWGSLSLLWGTSCSIRPIAFRSLQVFRALMPRVSQADLAQLLGRLSNTVAAQESNLHPFTVELIITLSSVARSGNLDSSLLPQLYWCTVACLSTPVEAEFLQLLDLLECLLDKLDLDDHYTAEALVANRPPDWRDDAYDLQPLLLVGLRSVKTYARTLKVLQRLSSIKDPRLIDSAGNRVRDMYTLILPWCLHSMEQERLDDNVVEFAMNISSFAEEEERPTISKIMTSFVKSRFRTKDDFLRQAAAALREHYAPHYWTEVTSLLLSLVLNQERWLQVKSMQILKVVFQIRETRNPVDRLGSELLMPLLRLIQTDLATQALDVLEEPMAISGGLAAKHVLRMSMHVPTPRDPTAETEMFGIPDESGWCIARPEKRRDICRANVMAVFDTCKVPTRPSKIDFEPEVDRFADPLEADLGDMVQNLHELSTFFLGEEIDNIPSRTLQPPVPNHQLEARVAAILAKSTDAGFALDSPQTPFVDVFSVGGNTGLRAFGEGSDDDSDSSDFDVDTFAFDTSSHISSEKGYQNGFFGLKKRR